MLKEKERTEIHVQDTSDKMSKVLEFAMEASRVLLCNGAEIFRVEETVEHICRRFDIKGVDTFVLSNGIFITAHDGTKEVFARVKHVPMRGINLGIVTEVNNLSREISSGKVDLDEAWMILKKIEKMPPNNNWFRIIASGVGSATFAYLLGANFWECMLTVLSGMLLFAGVIFAEKHNISKILVNLLGGAFITILALIYCNIGLPFVLRQDKLLVGSILPLVPGVAFTNSIRDIARSDFLSGTVKMIDALLVFVYIAIGVGTVLAGFDGLRGGMLQ